MGLENEASDQGFCTLTDLKERKTSKILQPVRSLLSYCRRIVEKRTPLRGSSDARHEGGMPEGMAAKSERQIDWEMGIVGMASSRRREEAVKSWRRSHGAAERENGGFFVTLGLSNAERSAANEAMIAEIPEVAFF